MFGFVKIIAHPVCRKQRAIQIICPTMIRAHQLWRGPAADGTNHGAAMAAAVVKGADIALPITRDDHRPFADHHR